ncbi:MAG: GNAT family N-acetyltransferase [Hyphomonadaceae bacterium]|nr:GNAT family N-acetyltransferase [Hyphomonadaceae bacterium]
MTTAVRPARLEELEDLTALCLRSKAYWGYDAAFMAACVDEVTLTPEDLECDPIGVLDDQNGLAGVAHVSLDQDGYYLDKLFIDTDRIGLGYGKSLFLWALGAARALGATELIIEADPDAAPFYEKMGCRRAGEVPSGSVAGRVLPRFVHPL